ncbi:hypothetical protein NUACC26_078520 [Scytonema sp. NUACC26]
MHLGFSDPKEKVNFMIFLSLCYVFQFLCKQNDTLIALSKAYLTQVKSIGDQS